MNRHHTKLAELEAAVVLAEVRFELRVERTALNLATSLELRGQHEAAKRARAIVEGL